MRGDKEKEKLVEEEEERQRKLLIIRKAFDETLRHPAGQEMFRYLFSLCGYDKRNVVVNKQTGGLEIQASLLNLVRREVYVDMRNMVSPKLLRSIEEPPKRSAPVTKK